MKFSHNDIAEGVRLHLCETDKFNSLTCKVFVQQDLNFTDATSMALLPLLFRRGSQKFPTTLHIARELEDLYSAEFGSDILKIGERQILEFYFQMVDPALLPQGEKQLERGLNAFWEIFTQPRGSGDRFLDNYFAQEKNTLEQDLEGLVNEKRAYAIARLVAKMCADEPFGVYKYGDVQVLQEIKNECVYQHYRNLLAKHPLDIFCVGSNLQEVAALITDLIPVRTDLVRLNKVQRPPVVEERFIEEFMEINQAVLILGYRTNCSYLDEDYYALLVANGILGGFAHSKLFMNVREKSSLAYSIGSNIEGSKGLLTIIAGISAEKQGQVLEIVKKQVDAMQNGQISTDELEQTKRGLISAMVSINDNPTGIIDRNLIGIVEGEIRTIGQVVQSIRAVEHDDCVRVMEKIKLDTTYILRPEQRQGSDRD